MQLEISEKIRLILGRRNITLGELAERTRQSRQNLSNKLSRNNFSEKEMREIAEALNCEFDTVFTLRDTGEKV